MRTHYSYGGDEHIFARCNEDMSLRGCLRALSLANEIRAANIPGIIDVCPANVTFQVRFDPDIIHPDAMLNRIVQIERGMREGAFPTLNTRLIEVPVYYDDPWTNAVGEKFRERHQNPSSTDIEYTARINGYSSVDDFVAAHAGTPWFVSSVHFVPGSPSLYQLVKREKQIEAPKYLRPRTETPRLTLGYGGCFSCVYPMPGAGGYQMLGVVAIPIYDPTRRITYLREDLCLFHPGDIVKWKPVDRREYDDIQARIGANSYELNVRPVEFSIDAFETDVAGVTAELMRALHD